MGSYLYIKQLLTIKPNYTYAPLVARQLRLNRAGLWYHVTARGNERKPIYRDNRDRLHFVELFAGWRELFRLHLHAYVLMPNHYHLLLETTEANLSRAMQWLNTSYTVWFNRRHQRTGHVLQGRFKAVVVEADRWALGLSRYIHSWGSFRDRRGDWGRELALYLGREQGGMTLAELGHAGRSEKRDGDESGDPEISLPIEHRKIVEENSGASGQKIGTG